MGKEPPNWRPESLRLDLPLGCVILPTSTSLNKPIRGFTRLQNPAVHMRERSTWSSEPHDSPAHGSYANNKIVPARNLGHRICMYNCMQGFFKKYILAGFLYIRLRSFFFPKNFKNPENYVQSWFHSTPLLLSFLPGPKAPQRDKEHSLDCQRSASTAKLPSHIISQSLERLANSQGSICKSNFAMTTLGKSPKNVCNSVQI